jgi:hypothetical protein
MRIIDIIRQRRNVIEADPDEAKDTGDRAIAALLDGIDSPAWDAYLAHFPGLNAGQLARLKGQDATAGDEVMNKKRVYVAANGMCGVNSPNTQTLAFQVNSIDEGLPEGQCDPEP